MLLPKGAKTGVVVLFFAWWMDGQRCFSAVAFSSFFCILLFVFGRPPPAPKKYTHVVLCTPSFCWFIYLCCRGRAALCCEKKKFLVLPVAAAAVHPTRGRNPVSCDDSSTLTRCTCVFVALAPPPPLPPLRRFGTKGLSISFVSTESDAKKLEEVQSRFEVNIPELPDTIETSTYMQAAT